MSDELLNGACESAPRGIRVQIISDGTPRGTRVVDVETGAQLRGVVAVAWECALGEGLGTALLRVKNVPARLEGDVDLERSTIQPLTGDRVDDEVLADSVSDRPPEHDHTAPAPECRCASTEASLMSCPAHGPDAPAD